MEKTIHLLEDQQSPRMVQERVVNENARHFESVLATNVNLPLNRPQELEDLNEALNDIELSVALVQHNHIIILTFV